MGTFLESFKKTWKDKSESYNSHPVLFHELWFWIIANVGRSNSMGGNKVHSFMVSASCLRKIGMLWTRDLLLFRRIRQATGANINTWCWREGLIWCILDSISFAARQGTNIPWKLIGFLCVCLYHVCSSAFPLKLAERVGLFVCCMRLVYWFPRSTDHTQD